MKWLIQIWDFLVGLFKRKPEKSRFRRFLDRGDFPFQAYLVDREWVGDKLDKYVIHGVAILDYDKERDVVTYSSGGLRCGAGYTYPNRISQFFIGLNEAKAAKNAYQSIRDELRKQEKQQKEKYEERIKKITFGKICGSK